MKSVLFLDESVVLQEALKAVGTLSKPGEPPSMVPRGLPELFHAVRDV